MKNKILSFAVLNLSAYTIKQQKQIKIHEQD